MGRLERTAVALLGVLELVAWVSRVYAAGPLALFLFSGKAFLSFSKFGVCGGLTSSDLCVCFPVVLLGFACLRKKKEKKDKKKEV